jgi:hypothetical protein
VLADFGHRRTAAAAHKLAVKAESVGFTGAEVQQRGCSDYAVVVPGLSSIPQGNELRKEARSAGLDVTLDCRSEAAHGREAAVFGRSRSRAGAVRLLAHAAGLGFRGLKVVETACNEWQVLLYGVSGTAEQKALVEEAGKVGIHVRFEPG